MVHKVLAWILVVALTLPASLTGCVSRHADYRAAGAGAHEAMAKREDARGEGGEMIPPPSPLALSPTSPHNGGQGESFPLRESPERAAPSLAAGGASSVARPRGLNEALFNTVASFMGLPGLAPQRGVDGSLDEGLGFHQDGTVRRAGSGDDFDGERARAYQRAGLGTGPGFGPAGLNGLAPSYGDERTAALWHDVDYSGRRDARNGARSLDSLNPFDLAVERGLNYGMGLLNSAGEAALSGLADDGRARLNFQMNKDGRLSGEGDVLLPLYDGRYTTLFTQLGARSMDVDGGEDDGSQRWIGNFGLGQRWFPLAESPDNAGNLMLGYNVFFDNDFSRSHQRGGAGVEAQYDWFHVAANYYTPLSGWKASRDFDGDFVEERPAQGWDARVKAYLPFYRNVALTGAYAQWYGDHVAMYGSSDDLEKDPKVWSYGVEYTPVPLVSGFVKQRSTERGKTDTEFGLQFTYHFNMPWDEQISHAKVAELRSVSGSRHEFVDRENRIILEYRAKNAYRIEYLGPDGSRGFLFRLRDGLGEYRAGQTVRVTASGAYLAEAVSAQPATLLARAADFLDGLLSVRAAYAAELSKTYSTDGQGRFWVQLDAAAPASATVTIQAGDTTQSFTLAGNGAGTLTFSQSRYTVSGTTPSDETTLEVRAFAADGTTPLTGDIGWTITSPGGNNGASLASAATAIGADGKATVRISGNNVQREVTVQASLSGQRPVTATVRFGTALPDGFIAYAGNNTMNWSGAKNYCTKQGGKLPLINHADSWAGGRLPSSIDGFGTGTWPSGFPIGSYWTGTENSGSLVSDYTWVVTASRGYVVVFSSAQSVDSRVVCVP